MHDAILPASGGMALVHWCPDVPAEELDEFAASMRNPIATLYTSVCVTQDSGHYVAECYSPDGSPIRFCGHGSMAAAWVAFNEHDPDAAVLKFANRQQSWRARRVVTGEADIALTYARPDPQSCAVPDFAEQCLQSKPVAAATVGSDADYLILELSGADAVKLAEPDVAAIAAASRRAFIVTARTDGVEPACVFRYFAPQYGVAEDDATGSAAVQLAAYWAPRFAAQRFTARQLSAAGATMRLSCHGDAVELAAHVGYG